MRANFGLLREFQNYFNESIVNLCIAAVERYMKGELDDDFPDETRDVRIQIFSSIENCSVSCLFL